jgi:uncharacterized protein (TIGR04222 family)
MELLDPPDLAFLTWFMPASIAAATLAVLLSRLLRPLGQAWQSDDPYDFAFFRAGPRGVFEAATAWLLHTRMIDVFGTGPLVRSRAETRMLRPPEQAVLGWVQAGAADLSQGVALVAQSMRPRVNALVDRGVMVSPQFRATIAGLASAAVFPLLVLGGIKAVVAVSHHGPVELLLLMLVILIVGWLLAIGLVPRLTRAGRRSYEARVEQYAPMRFAAIGGEVRHLASRDVLFCVALFGIVPFVGGELGAMFSVLHPQLGVWALRNAARPEESTSSCGGSSCGSSGCGGGCGGGGCGGCGGCGS